MKDWLKVILFAGFVAVVMATATGFKYVTVDYTVTESDKLQTIAERFIIRNTATVREINEFTEGIREQNYSTIGDGEVTAGQFIEINYWEAERCEIIMSF
jgi:uncharacterized membrane-anchored protein